MKWKSQACMTAVGLIAINLLVAAAPYQPDPDLLPAAKALFDPPIGIQHYVLPKVPGDPDPPGVVRCYSFSDFVVKENDTGQTGDDAISVIPFATSGSEPPCSNRTEAGEIVLKSGQGDYFLGAKGSFVFLISTADLDATQFTVVDGTKGKMLYLDYYFGPALIALSVSKNVLTMNYRHGAETDCSIVANGKQCWAQLATNGLLPEVIAARPPPITLCKISYAAEQPGPDSDGRPSVISYNVAMTLSADGIRKVLSRGPMSCDAGHD